MKKTIYILFAIATIFSACKKEEGCTDPIATNYNAEAEVDDGSCVYPPSPTFSLEVTGDTLVTENPNSQLTSHLTVTNVGNQSLDVRCKINPIINDSGTEFSFCWGGTCYAEGTLTSGMTATIAAGQTVTFPDTDAHSGYYDTFGVSSTGKAEFCFFDDANPSNETCFTVTFDATGEYIALNNSIE